MKTRKIRCLCAVLLLMLWGVPLLAYAESAPAEPDAHAGGRNIYVGDLIVLEISAESLSAGELREKFSAFEVVGLKEEPGGYLLTIRTFEPGEYKVLLGNKEIVINVGSTLEAIKREDVFEGGTRVIEPGIAWPWRTLFYIAAGIFLLSGGATLLKTLWQSKTKKLTPYQIFLRSAGTLGVERDSYLVDLTLLLKKLLEGLYQCRLLGKTSAEILHELKEIPALQPILPEIGEWLVEGDRLKFTGVQVPRGKKQEHYGKLLDLAQKINQLGSDGQKEGAV